jgi:hypothetical protein
MASQFHHALSLSIVAGAGQLGRGSSAVLVAALPNVMSGTTGPVFPADVEAEKSDVVSAAR